MAVREVLGLTVRHLADLPLSTTLAFNLLELDGTAAPSGVAPARLLLTTSRDVYDAAAARGELVLSPTEYEALAEALADGRLTTRGALEELRRKARALEGMVRGRADARPYRIERERIFAGVVHPGVPVGRSVAEDGTVGSGGSWTFGELAAALGADLVDVEVHGA